MAPVQNDLERAQQGIVCPSLSFLVGISPSLNLEVLQQSYPMPVRVSKKATGSTATPEIELHVVFPGEANSAQSLNSGIAGLPVTIAYKRFCHAHCLSNFVRSVVEGVSGIVDG